MLVAYFRRNEADQWIITVLTEPGEILVIPELNLTLTLAEIYDETAVVPIRIGLARYYCITKTVIRLIVIYKINNHIIHMVTGRE